MPPLTPSRKRVVLVSHGQPSDPQAGETQIQALAIALGKARPQWDVLGVTLAAKGALEAAMRHRAPPLIYPVFMADGWFTQSVLPKRLEGFDASQLPPLGLEPTLPEFTAKWLRGVLSEKGWAAQEVALLVAGHGSGRSPRPAEATRVFAHKVQARMGFREVQCGFVEEAPYIVDAARGVGSKAICLPFFALRRGHVLDDLPEALDAAGFSGPRLDPFGHHPEMPEFLADCIQRQTG